MIRTLIVGDENAVRQRLRRLLAVDSDIDVIAEATDGLEAVALIDRCSPDLVFLDVDIPDLDGFGVMQAIGLDSMPASVFVIAFAHPALPALELNAVDYLLKPFDEDRVRRALRRARAQVGRPRSEVQKSRLQGVVNGLPKNRTYPDRVLTGKDESRQWVRTSDILYVTALANAVRLHTRSGIVEMRDGFHGIEWRLDPARFRRIDRATLVNLEHVSKLLPWFGGDYKVVMSDGEKLTLGRTFRDALPEHLA